jgi:hypothetical protein
MLTTATRFRRVNYFLPPRGIHIHKTGISEGIVILPHSCRTPLLPPNSEAKPMTMHLPSELIILRSVFPSTATLAAQSRARFHCPASPLRLGSVAHDRLSRERAREVGTTIRSVVNLGAAFSKKSVQQSAPFSPDRPPRGESALAI